MRRLCALKVLVLGGIGDDGRIGHLLRKLFEAFFELIELLSELHGGLRDDHLSALAPFQSHGAFQGADGHLRLVVGGGFGGDALEPESRSGESGQERAPPPGGIPDQFIAEAHDER